MQSKETGSRTYKSTAQLTGKGFQRYGRGQEGVRIMVAVCCGKGAETPQIPSVCQSIRLSVSPAFMPLVLVRVEKWRSCGRGLSGCKMSSRLPGGRASLRLQAVHY